MPRRKGVKPKKIESDSVYGSPLVAKLINRSMRDGKKSVAQKQVYKAFDMVKEKTKSDPLDVFNVALENIRPAMEVRPRRVGGAAYQVPMPVRGNRKDTLAIRWLIFAARSRSEHTFAEQLAGEIVDASNKEGTAVSKMLEVQRMAEANRAFSHFRW